MKRKVLAALCAWLFLAPIAVSYGATIRVPADQPTILAAIVHAAAGDTVLVAPGTYTGTGNRNLFVSFDLVLRSEAGPSVTIIDCQNGTTAITFSDVSSLTRVEGFTIQNGFAYEGAGITCDRASPTFLNCVFLRNSSSGPGGAVYLRGHIPDGVWVSPVFTACTFSQNASGNPSSFGRGGAVASGEYCSPEFIDCIFGQNTASGGGSAISSKATPGQGSQGRPTITLTRCSFAQNGTGGALELSGTQGESTTIADCTFDGNLGDAVTCFDGASPIILDCDFNDNAGVGLRCASSSPRLTNCILSRNSGGGAWCYSASAPEFSTCTFSENGIASGFFGGLYCQSFSSPRLTSCVFTGNRARDGAGAYVSASPIFTNCTFRGNVADHSNYASAGGAVYCIGDTSTFTACSFDSNYARFHGGAIHNRGSRASFSQCVFASNRTADGSNSTGGAVACEQSSFPRFEACTFSGNASSFGGALFCDDRFSGPELVDCILTGNIARSRFASVASAGGAIYAASATQVYGCMLSSNTATVGGGMACYGSRPELVLTTLWGNSATKRGGGLYVGAADVVPVRCTFVANAADSAGGGIYFDSAGTRRVENTIIAYTTRGGSITCGGTTEPQLICCDLYGNTGGDWVACIAHELGFDGNISANPMFCAWDVGNFGLAANSPCLPPQSTCGVIGADSTSCLTPVGLAWFVAAPHEDGVHVSWRTSREQDHVGFQVFRAAEGSEYENVSGATLIRNDDGARDYVWADHAVVAGSYLYRLDALDLQGGRETFGPVTVTVASSSRPRLVLRPGRPNPFGLSTAIEFDLPRASGARLAIYNMAGRLVRLLTDEQLPAGVHWLTWDGRSGSGFVAPAGVYVARLDAGGEVLSEKVTIAR